MQPPKSRARLVALCEPVNLVLSAVLSKAGTPTRHVYFPLDGGFVSPINVIDGEPALEVGMVGSEGMVGVHLVLGVVTTPLQALVQGSGAALRVDAKTFITELAANPALRNGLNRYLYVLMNQLASSASCLRFHQIGPRLARWLLMTQDRAHEDAFHVTHEFLAYMLGVRRVGITLAAKSLSDSGLIEYRRGAVRVLNRAGLTAAACSCYATDRRTYARLLS